VRRAFLVVIAVMSMSTMAGASEVPTVNEVDAPPYGAREEDLGLEGDWSTHESMPRDSETVKSYAFENDISEDRAFDVLMWQGRVSDKASALPDLIPELAEVRFVRGDDRLIVEVKGDGASARAIVAREFGSDADRVEVRGGAAMTRSERVEFQAANPTRKIDPVTGRVTENQLVAHPSVEVQSCQQLTGGTTDAGRLVIMNSGYPDTFLSETFNDWTDCFWTGFTMCSQAFTATHNTAGSPHYQGYLTAGHCGGNEATNHYWTSMYANNMEHSYAGHKAFQDFNSTYDDVQFNREVYASTSPENRVYIDEENGYRSITSSNGSFYVPVDTYLCAKSAFNGFLGAGKWARHDDTAGFWCGYTTDNDENPHSVFGWGRWFSMDVSPYYLNRRFGFEGGVRVHRG